MRETMVPIVLMIVALPLFAWAQDGDAQHIRELESDVSSLQWKVQHLESEMNRVREHLDGAAVVFFFAVFCAWWAQHTDRSPWGWFFLGLFFHIITAFVLLYKNAGDKRRKDQSWRIS